MSAAELRQAAETLRGLADDAISGIGPASMQSEWRANHDRYDGETTIASGEFQVGQVYCIQTGEYIATMHPGVGLVLADWLDEVASFADQYRPLMVRQCGEKYADDFAPEMDQHALAIARLINGGAS